MPIISCINCGKSFERSSSKIKRAKHSFCSPGCQSLWFRKIETRDCDWCGKPVTRHPSQIKKHIFCHQECYGKWQKAQHKPKNKPCATCGEPVFANPARLKKKVFCSKECFHLSQFKTETKSCEYCGDPVTRRPSEFRKGGKHVFCSHECCDNFRRGKPHPDPEHGEKVSRKLKGRKTSLSPEGRKALSEASRKRLLDPKYQAIMQEGLRKYNETHPGHWKGIFGPASPNWRGGTSFEPYGPEFTSDLKLRIRKRDNHECQLCGRSEAENLQEFGRILSIHHINYIKTDCQICNLIALCSVCHSITHGNRNYYQSFLRKNQSGTRTSHQLYLPNF